MKLKLVLNKYRQLKEFFSSSQERSIKKDSFNLVHNGFCPCCDSKVIYSSDNLWLRDNLQCSNCQSIPRERALMMTIEKYYPNWKDLDIHESSPVNRGASMKLKNYAPKYVASQFYSNVKLGGFVDGFRNEDLENQTFEDEQFDLVVTQDVMEHIYEPDKAFKEIARTLKKGGSHIFTVPLINKFGDSKRWAIKGENGKPKFLYTPEFHGNPIDPEGSPVTYHWGFDIVSHIDNACGLNSKIEYNYDLDNGIWAEYIEVVVTTR